MWIQLGKIAFYEFRMHWRERALLVLMLSLGILSVVSMLIMSTNTVPIQVDMHRAVVSVLAAPLSVTLAVLLPIIISNAIPKDQQWGVRELMDTLPVRRGVYIAGKVFGMWASVLCGLVVLAALTALVYLQLFGSLDFGLYIEMWFVVGVMLVLTNGTLGVLLPATQPNRRRAAVLMVLVFTVSFLFSAGSLDSNSLLAYLNPIRPTVIMHYLNSLNTSTAAPAAQNLVSAVQVAVVWGALLMWLRWKESRS